MHLTSTLAVLSLSCPVPPCRCIVLPCFALPICTSQSIKISVHQHAHQSCFLQLLRHPTRSHLHNPRPPCALGCPDPSNIIGTYTSPTALVSPLVSPPAPGVVDR
ncbi:hypothetical protein DM02DRAFT_422288 [Periconia macrospinosa]|uniref:Secreted protein n=1 Tax=Periconia macrospinosa TaxID=97972 RepID=A0A2V1CY03_9PLEO|nr:hypothetical protein DM02DRAFT_422288 [Periconia macrospinosa]